MRVEAEAKVGAPKDKHSPERTTHLSSYRVRRMHSQLGSLYLMVAKVSNGGYMCYLMTEKKWHIFSTNAKEGHPHGRGGATCERVNGPEVVSEGRL